MTRTRAQTLSLAITIAMLGTAAMAGGPANAQEPRRGGTLVYAVLGDPPTIDCHAASSFATMHYVSPHYSLLIKIDPNDPSKVAPDVAQSWTASDDKLSYTFKLRSGVTFHDGSPLTSEDVKASFDRIRNPPAGITSIRKSVFTRIAAIETPEPLTAVFKLKTASPAFLHTIASPFNCLYSAKRLAADPNNPANEVMGSGPFQFVERVAGAHWTAKRFDGYFDKLRLVNRNIADPYTSAGIYLIDQWRQIGVVAEHAQVDVKTLTNAMRSGEFDAIIDFQGEGVDDPSIVFARNVSADASSYNPSGFVDRRLDELYARIDSEFDPTARKALVREFERHFLSEAYQVPFLWLNRTVAMPARLKGFIMTPSHFLNQDLGGLWLAE
jgi:ABC-type transport system substrate-binding protein